MLRDEDIVTYAIDDDEAERGTYAFENELDDQALDNTRRFRSILADALEARGRLLAKLIAPTSVRDFAEQHWAQRPILAANAHNRLVLPTLYSEEALKSALAKNLYRREDYRFVQDQQYHPDREFFSRQTSDAIDADRAEQFVEQGGSVVIDDIHRYHASVNEIWQELVAVCRFPVTCTAYYTPAGRMTFPTHWDTDDVFVLQLQGRKHWSVHEPVIRDPLEHHRWGKYTYELGQPLLEITLAPGDVLYVPRGFPHKVVAHAEHASLHITAGVCLPTWHMCLRLLVQRVLLDCGQQARFRQPCPALLENETPQAASQVFFDGLLKEFHKRLTVRTLRSKVEDFMARQALWGTTEVDRLGRDDHDVDSSAITPGEILYRRRQLVFLTRTDDNVVLKFAGKEVVLPGWIYSAVQHITEVDCVRARDLPGGLDIRDRQVLLGRLLREGFFTKRSLGRPLSADHSR